MAVGSGVSEGSGVPVGSDVADAPLSDVAPIVPLKVAVKSWACPWQLSCRMTCTGLPSQVTEFAWTPLKYQTSVISP